MHASEEIWSNVKIPRNSPKKKSLHERLKWDVGTTTFDGVFDVEVPIWAMNGKIS